MLNKHKKRPPTGTLPKKPEMPEIYLRPGEAYLARRPTVIQTVLGSCVSVTFYNSRLAVAAICHALLPRCVKGEACKKGSAVCLRYVDCSVYRMLDDFAKLGIGLDEIEAKLFGGANMFEAAGPDGEGRLVGGQNIEMAEQILATEGIRVVTSDTGGRQGRKLFFYSLTGEVFVKRLRKMRTREFPLAAMTAELLKSDR